MIILFNVPRKYLPGRSCFRVSSKMVASKKGIGTSLIIMIFHSCIDISIFEVGIYNCNILLIQTNYFTS